MKQALFTLVALVILAATSPVYADSQPGVNLDALVESLRDENPDARMGAAEVLGALGRFAIPALPALLDAQDDEDEDVRDAVSDAISLIIIDSADETIRLIGMLYSRDAEERYVAANILAERGYASTMALPVLLRVAYKDANLSVRRAAKEALREIKRLGGEPSVHLLELLNSYSPDLRRYAARALGDVGPGPGVVPALIDAIDDLDRFVGIGAIESLGAIGPDAADAVPVLIEALGNEDDWWVRYSAVNTLCSIGPAAAAAIPKICVLVADDDEDVCNAAMRAIEENGIDPVPYLMEMLHDPYSQESFDVINALAVIGEPALPSLIETLGEEDDFVRSVAIIAIGRLGPDAADAMPALLDTFEDWNPNVRRNCLFAFAQIGPGAKDAVPVLIEALSDEDIDTCIAAASALGGIGPDAKHAVPALIKAIQEPDPPLPPDSPWAMRRPSGPGYIAPSLRFSAACALGDIGFEAADAIPALIALLGDEDENLLFPASLSLGEIGMDAVPALMEAARDDNRDVRYHAIFSFYFMGPEAYEAIPLLMETLDDEDGEIRKQAAFSLGGMGLAAEEAIPKLQELAENDEDEDVRKAAATAIDHIKSDWTWIGYKMRCGILNP